jgi:hypothetical protein
MITLKYLLTEQTAATIYCKRDILSKPQFSANKWKSIGIWSNRNIGNTNRKSEHAFGNAIDWSGKGGVGDPVMQELANYLVSKADVYNIQNIIYNRKAWNSKQGWHTYKIPPGGSPHLDHVHVDFKKVNATANIDNQKNNDLLQRAIWTIYNTITRYPERHFKQFKSWNPLKGGDNEGAAAKYFSKFGDYFGTNFFFNTKKYNKIINTLTFSSNKAKDTFHWNPKSVLDYFNK